MFQKQEVLMYLLMGSVFLISYLIIYDNKSLQYEHEHMRNMFICAGNVAIKILIENENFVSL